MAHFLVAWLITVMVEFFILWLFTRDRPSKLFLYSLLINSFTLPLATYSYYNILNNIYIIEIAVIFIESILIILLLEIKYKTAFLISLTANFVTAVIGFFI
ncbi:MULTISPECIES: hypothetical protein [Methanobacterium]|jgi:hypothetical protein|uniref:Uncharacterized protein n=1 Tax=Methanobacterium veterum TaxID=408577 RepID=A0A9E5DK24_9EURY|nr:MULTISPECIES: hypothetical protein [Methanobacterium]MCZ3372044.1 hypothetical protein [Methanobacterium veterum]